MKFPFRLTIASQFLDGSELCVNGVMDKMRGEYAEEKQFSRKNVESDLMALKAVGILKPSDGEAYMLSPYGREKVEAAL